MASCLGLYINENLIKYAKVEKEKDNLKVETYGVKFYEKLDSAIKQIIEETYSYKTPISMNLSEEDYQYFNMYAMINKKDFPKAIKTEFEGYCSDKGYNPNVFETRYALVENIEDKEKIKVINVSNNKIDINKKVQQLQGYKIAGIFPIGMSITNLNKFENKENALIVNIEDKTTITTVIEQKVYEVKTLDIGSQDFLLKINLKENSYPKSYEICKETTIYTSNGKDLGTQETGYLEDIMPTLYDIVGQVKKVINESIAKIDKVYITGTAALINNIDLYFEEYLENVKCELLKTDFLGKKQEINIKDYIEVNSAIALALQGLGYGLKDMNFQHKNWKDDLNGIFSKSDSSNDKKDKTGIFGKSIDLSSIFRFNLNEKLDNIEKWMLRVAGGILALTIIYCGFSMYLNYAIQNKNIEVADVKTDTQMQIDAVNSDIEKVNQKTNQYQQLSDNLKNISEQAAENSRNKKSIPNLLSQIMFSIPQGVQVTSIENTNSRHIVINAQSEKYEQLGIFKAILKTQGILAPDTVVSSSGTKSGDVVQVVIEGDLP